MIRVGIGFYIPCSQITFVGSYDTRAVRRKALQLKEEGRYLNVTRNKRTKTVIFYTDLAGIEHGVGSNFEAETILKKMAEINEKGK